MKAEWHLFLAFMCLLTAAPNLAIASPATSLLEALARYATKEGGGESAAKLTTKVSEAATQRVSMAVTREGGDKSLQRTSLLVAEYGPDVIRALDNAPAAVPVLKALDDLPAEQVPQAAARLAAGQRGRELAETTARFGTSALRAEVAHPGVGGRFVRALGTEGAALCSQLSRDQVVALGRHVDDVASLPPSQRQRVLDLVREDTDRFFSFVGRFVEANPGKTLFTTAVTGIVLANPERFLGGDEIVIGADGEPTILTKPGLIGLAGDAVGDAIAEPVAAGASWLTRGLAIVVVTAVAMFASIKLWGVWRRETQSSSEL